MERKQTTVENIKVASECLDWGKVILHQQCSGFQLIKLETKENIFETGERAPKMSAAFFYNI